MYDGTPKLKQLFLGRFYIFDDQNMIKISGFWIIRYRFSSFEVQTRSERKKIDRWNSNVFTYRRLHYNENAAQMEKRVRSKQGKKLFKVEQVLWNFHQVFNKRSTLLSKRLTIITKLNVFYIFSLQCVVYSFNFFCTNWQIIWHFSNGRE